MSGHSKWHNIKIRKAKVDAEKGKTFAKLAREIIVAAREGGGDVAANSRLRLAIARAKDAGMPNDNIDRAVKRGTGDVTGERVEEAIYEGYGPNGVALLIQVMTDNRNRTAPEVRKILSKNGGSLGEAGCVRWLFQRKGLIVVPTAGVSEEDLLLAALDAGAEDVRSEGDTFEVYCEPEAVEKVRRAVEEAGFQCSSAEVTHLPSTTVSVDGADARRLLNLMEQLEDHADVQEVFANFDIPEQVMAEELG